MASRTGSSVTRDSSSTDLTTCRRHTGYRSKRDDRSRDPGTATCVTTLWSHSVHTWAGSLRVIRAALTARPHLRPLAPDPSDLLRRCSSAASQDWNSLTLRPIRSCTTMRVSPRPVSTTRTMMLATTRPTLMYAVNRRGRYTAVTPRELGSTAPGEVARFPDFRLP